MNDKTKTEILLLVVSLVLISCGREPLSTGEIVSWKENTFLFDPEIAIEEINDGKQNIFIKVDEEPDVERMVNRKWIQDDYFTVIDYLAGQYLPASFQEAYVVGMHLGLLCEEIEQYDHGINVIFYRYYGVDESQVDRFLIFVSPEYGLVNFDIETRTGVTMKRIQFDINKTQIPYEQALSIAEEHGGREFRDERKNECGIGLELDPDNDTELYWEVEYHGPKPYITGDYYRVYVDAVTGEVIDKE